MSSTRDEDASLLGLLSRYRFTTQESTPDDQSVDPDPELLGRVFENLYQEVERHDSGTYYTPREIVHFMCREALDGYLRDKTGVAQDALNALRQVASGTWDDQDRLPNVPAASLIDALETVNVCDPAVGSGAFLLGAIQEIVALRRGILLSQRSYVEPGELDDTVSKWKQRIIENNLYGVDINPEAVEICQLRLWLSMVLQMLHPPTPNSGWALPNLDFRIVAGDSLVDRAGGVTFKESWPPPTDLQFGMELHHGLQQLEEYIASRRSEFERTHGDPERLKELRNQIAGYQREVVRLHLADALAKAKADRDLQNGITVRKNALRQAQARVDQFQGLYDGLDTADFTLVQKPFLWPIAFPDILKEGNPNAGFDIVLANPPYVRMEKLDNEDEQAYKEAFPLVSAPRADLLVYFYARALQILRPGGWLSFITSNKFMRAGYGGGLREHLSSSLRIQRVIDFGDLPLFDAGGKTVAAYPAVLVGARSSDADGHALKVADLARPIRADLAIASVKVNAGSVRGVLEDLDDVLARAETTNFPQLLLKREGWVLEDSTLVRLSERLMGQGTPLGKVVDGRLYRGVVTGYNKAFVIKKDKRDDLIAEDPNSEELIKPWLRGRDIMRWRAERAGLYIIFTSRGVDIDHYPAIEEHLRWYKADLEARATSHLHPWYELQQPQEGIYEEFALPKIIWPDIANKVRFAWDSTGSYLGNTAYAMPTDAKWLLTAMNSALVEFLLCQITNSIRGGFMRLIYQYVTQVPIVTPDAETQERFADIAEAGIIGAPVDTAELNALVYELYGLASSEVRLVEEWFARRG